MSLFVPSWSISRSWASPKLSLTLSAPLKFVSQITEPVTVTPPLVVSSFLLSLWYSSTAAFGMQRKESLVSTAFKNISSPSPRIYKSPWWLSIYESVPLWYSCKSWLAPSCNWP